MLTTLLPSSIAPISVSASASSRLTTPRGAVAVAARAPCMRAARGGRCSAVSAAGEEGREHEAGSTTMAASQRSTRRSSIMASQPALSSIRKARTAAASTSVRDEGLADAAGEDEGQLAALHLLVLRHGVDQRVGAWPRRPDLGKRGSAGRRREMAPRRAPASCPRAEPEPRREAEGQAMPIATASPCTSRAARSRSRPRARGRRCGRG